MMNPKVRCPNCKMLYWRKHTCQRNPKVKAFRDKIKEMEEDYVKNVILKKKGRVYGTLPKPNNNRQ